jgi:chromosome segregation ATPase
MGAQIGQVVGETNGLLQEIKNLRKDNDTVFKRRADAEHYVRDLDHETANIQRQVAEVKDEIALIRTKSGGNDELIEELNRCISNSEAHVKRLQNEEIELGSAFDRQKFEIAHLNKSIQNELAKNSMIRDRIAQGEGLLLELSRQTESAQDEGLDE